MSQQHVEKNVQKYLNENCIRLNPSEKKLQDQINREIVSTQNQCCTADCGQLMRVLIRGTNAARCLEIGCGMTTLSMAMAMQNEGKLVTINNLERTVTPQMKNIWKEAGVDTKINVRLGETMEQIDKLCREPGMGCGKWDLIVINNVDRNIKNVVDKCLGMLRPNGMLLVNHVLWNGNVLNESLVDNDTKAIRDLNKSLRDNQAIEVCTLPIGDGLTICTKI